MNRNAEPVINTDGDEAKNQVLGIPPGIKNREAKVSQRAAARVLACFAIQMKAPRVKGRNAKMNIYELKSTAEERELLLTFALPPRRFVARISLCLGHRLQAGADRRNFDQFRESMAQAQAVDQPESARGTETPPTR